MSRMKNMMRFQQAQHTENINNKFIRTNKQALPHTHKTKPWREETNKNNVELFLTSSFF